MHISEGVLDYRALIAGYVCTIGLAAAALKKLKQEDIPKVSVMGACFFVSSLIPIPVGISSVHLLLFGVLGIILGFESVIAVITGLLFQALMFQHGGISVLGVNTVIMSLPVLFVHFTFRTFYKKLKNNIKLLGIISGILSFFAVLIGMGLAMLFIYFTGKEFMGFAFVFALSHIVLAVIEGIITTVIIYQILRIKPGMIAVQVNKTG